MVILKKYDDFEERNETNDRNDLDDTNDTQGPVPPCILKGDLT